jgi:hypothetical protein
MYLVDVMCDSDRLVDVTMTVTGWLMYVSDSYSWLMLISDSDSYLTG